MVYGLIPLLVHAVYFTHKRVVTCPRTGGLAEIEIDAPEVPIPSPRKEMAKKVTDCSLWYKIKECDKGCLK